MSDHEIEISITRHFDAAPADVFAAWIEPALFARWFGTEGTVVDDVVMDPTPGGQWSARMIVGEGAAIGWHGSYVEVDAPHRLVLTLSDRPGDEFEVVTVLLDEDAGGTAMTFTQAGGHVPPEFLEQTTEGWRSFFDDLAALVTS
jgi:uncharacterized protein YndB with AHSA1/START domain